MFCRKCGAQLAPDAQFCPKCGTPVAAATPATTAPNTSTPHAAPPHAATPATAASAGTPIPARVERRGGAWWIVPLVIVGIVLIAWLLLAGLPFGRDREERAEAPAVETIAEGTAPPATPQPTGTIVDVDVPPVTTTVAPPPVSTTATTTTTAPTATTAPPAPPPRTTTQEPPRVIEEPQAPVPAPTTPREITEGEATAVLRGFITSRTYYDGVPSQCVQLRPSGYRNAGFGFSVWDACVSGGGSRMLGRWRVDSKTREVFVQREDGRYLRP